MLMMSTKGDHDVTNLQNFRDEAVEIFKRGKFELRNGKVISQL